MTTGPECARCGKTSSEEKFLVEGFVSFGDGSGKHAGFICHDCFPKWWDEKSAPARPSDNAGAKRDGR